MHIDSNFFLEHLHIGEAVLSPEESSHLTKSFRARVGDRFVLCDGKGRFAEAELVELALQARQTMQARVIIKSVSEQEPPPQAHLAIACMQNSSEEDIVFHAAQMPLAAIHLLRTERSQERDLSKLHRRMEAKSLVALKQSRKAWLTEIKAPLHLNEFLENFKGNLIVCDKSGSPKLPSSVASLALSTAILSGPEGGFSAAELEAMKSKGAHLLSLGNTRLRAVTAPILALALISFCSANTA